MKPKVPTIEDVALKAGVSTATVSRCLNSPHRVSPNAREKVLAAINDLGYAPNFGAQALAAKRTNTFGAIIPTMENAIFAAGLQAFQEELGSHGITLLVASSSYKSDLEREQIKALVARGADALLLIGHDRSPETYSFLEHRKIPYVVAWAHDSQAVRPQIGFDNRRAMRSLTEDVLSEGHRKLALVTADISGNDRARARQMGVIDAVKSAGLAPSDLQIVQREYSISAGADALDEILASDQRPTAILCGNDVLAVGVVSKASELGLRIPEDLSVTGFDDIELASVVRPGLTTVKVPDREMGRGAARALFELLQGQAPTAPSVELPATVVRRGSLGAVPKPSAR